MHPQVTQQENNRTWSRINVQYRSFSCICGIQVNYREGLVDPT